MNTEEMTRFLARIQIVDNRQVDRVTLQHWNEVCGDLELSEALAALVIHCRESTDYLKPAHIIAIIRDANRHAQRRRFTIKDHEADTRSARARGLVARDWPDNQQIPDDIQEQLDQIRRAENIEAQKHQYFETRKVEGIPKPYDPDSWMNPKAPAGRKYAVDIIEGR